MDPWFWYGYFYLSFLSSIYTTFFFLVLDYRWEILFFLILPGTWGLSGLYLFFLLGLWYIYIYIYITIVWFMKTMISCRTCGHCIDVFNPVCMEWNGILCSLVFCLLQAADHFLSTDCMDGWQLCCYSPVALEHPSRLLLEWDRIQKRWPCQTNSSRSIDAILLLPKIQYGVHIATLYHVLGIDFFFSFPLWSVQTSQTPSWGCSGLLRFAEGKARQSGNSCGCERAVRSTLNHPPYRVTCIGNPRSFAFWRLHSIAQPA